MDTPYDYRNCQSLFGYASTVHERSGGVCQLCGCGGDRVDFDLWRQLTVEHLIGASQGGYLRQIQSSLAQRFPSALTDDLRRVAILIDDLNTITACSFCNSTTSRTKSDVSMDELIVKAAGELSDVPDSVARALRDIQAAKRQDVERKILAVRAAFEQKVAAPLEKARLDSARGRLTS